MVVEQNRFVERFEFLIVKAGDEDATRPSPEEEVSMGLIDLDCF